MNNINIIGNILNLNFKKYKIVNYINKKNNILEFHIKGINSYCDCPQCGLKVEQFKDTIIKNKNIKRQGFGFKIKDNYFKKIWINELSKKSNLFFTF